MLDNKSEKLNKLKSILQMMDENISREEFVKSFEQVVKFILEIRKKNEFEMDKLREEYAQIIQQAKEEITAFNFDEPKEKLKKLMGNVEKEIELRLYRITQEHLNKMEEVNRKISSVRNGVDGEAGKNGDDGKPGKDADEKKIIDSVLAMIKLPDLKSLEEKIKKLEEGGTGRVSIFGGSRPFQIQSAGTAIDKYARVINFTGATVSRSTDGVTTVAVTGGGVETPSGTMNSTNKTFTVLHTPIFLTWQGQMLYENSGYSLTGLTITLDVAPDSGDTLRSHY